MVEVLKACLSLRSVLSKYTNWLPLVRLSQEVSLGISGPFLALISSNMLALCNNWPGWRSFRRIPQLVLFFCFSSISMTFGFSDFELN